MERLAELRAQIDQLDQELLQLLAKRLEVVHKVGEVKQQHGLPIYVPQREIEMLQRKREAAEQLGLSPDLIEDILRRIMRESYVSENQFGFKTVNPQIRKIVIVGGRGKLGSLFGRYLSGSGYNVVSLEQNDWPQAAQILQDADVVIVSVPIANTTGRFNLCEACAVRENAGGSSWPCRGFAPDVRAGCGQYGETNRCLLRWTF